MSAPGPVPHVGGAILPAGCVTVLIHGQPAARVGDRSMCNGPPDSIVMGEPTVVIGNRAAARVGDPTAHGGVIVAGCGCVQIGQVAQAVVMQAAARSGAAFCEECARQKAAARQKKVKAVQATAPRPAKAVSPGVNATRRAIDVRKALAHLDAHAAKKSSGRCARFVNDAIVAGGARGYGRGHAWQTGGSMAAVGFSQVASQDDYRAGAYQPQAGDTVVFDRVPKHEWGHVAMYDGTQWVSDYKQGDTPFAAKAYQQGTFRFYRP